MDLPGQLSGPGDAFGDELFSAAQTRSTGLSCGLYRATNTTPAGAVCVCVCVCARARARAAVQVARDGAGVVDAVVYRNITTISGPAGGKDAASIRKKAMN